MSSELKLNFEKGISIHCFQRRPQKVNLRPLHCDVKCFDCDRWKSQTMYIFNVPQSNHLTSWSKIAWRRHHYQWRDSKLILCTALKRPLNGGKGVIMLWHGDSFFAVPSDGTSMKSPWTSMKYAKKGVQRLTLPVTHGH